MNQDLLYKSVHLPLTDLSLRDGQVTGLGQTLTGQVTVIGFPKVVVDADFGSAVALNRLGERDEGLEDSPPEHFHLNTYEHKHGVSLGVWLRMDAGCDGSRLQNLFTWSTPNRTLHIRILPQSGEICVDDGTQVLHFDADLPTARWVHVLLTCNKESIVSICINGSPLEDQPLSGTNDSDQNGSVYLGGDPNDWNNGGFSGRLTHFRMFWPLRADEGPVVHSLDRVPTENYRNYAPLEARLTDEKQEPKLYVEGGEIAHRLRLSIWNRDENDATIILSRPSAPSAKTLEQHRALAPFVDMLDMQIDQRNVALAKLTKTTRDTATALLNSNPVGRASALNDFRMFFENNHHFELRFATGVLSKKTKTWIMNTLVRTLSRAHDINEPLWYISTGAGVIDGSDAQNDDGNDSLYLMATHDCDDLLSQGSASAAADLTIMLAHIAVRAELDGQVIPVEVRPGPLTRRAADFARLGPSIQLLEVQSQIGQQYVPLHFSVVGSDRVINDGIVETKVLLRMTNIDRENAISIDRIGNLQTVFSLSCDLTETGDQQDWALSDQQAKVQLWVKPASMPADPVPDPDANWDTDPLVGHSDGRTLSWAFDGHHIGTDTLVPEASVYMRISVITDQRTGPATLQLKYRHIPGYWDGSRHCTLTKSPMVMDWNTSDKKSRVGIGVAKPSSKLSISDGVSIGANYATDHTAPPGGMNVEGSVAIGTPVPNKYAKLHVEGGGLHVGNTPGNAYLRIQSGANRSTVYTDSGTGYLHIRTDNYSQHILLQSTAGFVGIGVNQPKFPLQVKGRIQGVLDGSDLVAKSVPLEALAQMVQNALCPTGTILAYGGTKAPDGWEICDGRWFGKYSVKHGALFAVIGDSFSEAWVTEFNKDKPNSKKLFSLPDLRGMFLRGLDNTWESKKTARDKDRDIRNKDGKHPGAKGQNIGSVQDDAFKTHTHTYQHTQGKAPLGDKEGDEHFSVDSRSKPETHATGGSETRPINIYVNYIIKL
jgi:hypothetical protein